MMCRKSDSDSIARTVSCLKNGEVVIIPTDTVYGFSGAVDMPDKPAFRTDDKIRKIKGRSETKPLIQLLAAPGDIYNYTDTDIPVELLNKWPGPLTLIVKNKSGGGTTAFRCPGDEWLRSVIAACGSPIYSTSVNRSGSPVLQTVHDICSEFEKECSLIVAAGDTKNALPSTIVSLVSGKMEIIRRGTVKININ